MKKSRAQVEILNDEGCQKIDYFTHFFLKNRKKSIIGYPVDFYEKEECSKIR